MVEEIPAPMAAEEILLPDPSPPSKPKSSSSRPPRPCSACGPVIAHRHLDPEVVQRARMLARKTYGASKSFGMVKGGEVTARR
jgi:hypothetical protein